MFRPVPDMLCFLFCDWSVVHLPKFDDGLRHRLDPGQDLLAVVGAQQAPEVLAKFIGVPQLQGLDVVWREPLTPVDARVDCEAHGASSGFRV